MYKYQACLYSFECISHGDSKYGHEIPKCWHFFKICYIFYLSSALACRMESIKVDDDTAMDGAMKEAIANEKTTPTIDD